MKPLTTSKGGRYWRLKYRNSGKENLLALGVYPETSLRLARSRRDAARQALIEGLDLRLLIITVRCISQNAKR